MTTRQKTAQHTPGPWRLEGNWKPDNESLGGWVSTIHPSPLFSLEPITGTRESILADARLIAAAPELLDALKEMVELFKFALLCTTPEIAKDGMEFVRKAEALVAKAEGR